MPDTRLYHVGLALQKMAANYIESIDQDRDLRLLISFLSKRLENQLRGDSGRQAGGLFGKSVLL